MSTHTMPQSLFDLDLPNLPLEDSAFAQDPFAGFDAARRQHPWLAKWSMGYVVTGYQAARELMSHEDKMRMSHPTMVEMIGASGTRWGEFIATSIQGQNGQAHYRLRSIVASAFSPRQANVHRAIMREVVAKLLDEWAPRRTFDFEEFASFFPITVMCRIIGASPDVLPSLQASLEALGLGGSMDPDNVPMFESAFQVLDDFVRELVAARRAGERLTPEEDLLDVLLVATTEDGLTDDELYNLLNFLFIGGYDTSKNMLTFIMDLLLDRPDDYERCAYDPKYCRRIVDEGLRFRSVASLPRIVAEDFVLRDVLLPKGALLLFPWSMLGRDPAATEQADVFDPQRPGGSPHMAFGLGPHMCLGQFIARAQIEEGLHIIAQRLKRPVRRGGSGRRPFVGVWGLKGLPIACEEVS